MHYLWARLGTQRKRWHSWDAGMALRGIEGNSGDKLRGGGRGARKHPLATKSSQTLRGPYDRTTTSASATFRPYSADTYHSSSSSSSSSCNSTPSPSYFLLSIPYIFISPVSMLPLISSFSLSSSRTPCPSFNFYYNYFLLFSLEF